MISRALNVAVDQRGNAVQVGSHDGSFDRTKIAIRVIEQLYDLVADGRSINATDVHHAIRLLQADPSADLRSFFSDTVLIDVHNRPITPRTAGQRRYVQVLRTHDITLGVGPAGTGKTYLAMATAVAALKRGDVKRIVLTRPAVEAGEKLGFLPGDLNDKVDPYLRPLYDALEDMAPKDRVARMLETQVIEVAPLAFMRGRTLNDAYVVLDEAQNTTVEQMRMFLTRLGERSMMIINGAATQIDLPRHRTSGMVQALRILSGIEKIGVVHMTSKDVVRHPLVAEIIEAYQANDDARRDQDPDV